jgi:hypothetical protein
MSREQLSYLLWLVKGGMLERATTMIEQLLAKPEQEPFKPDWVNYRQGLEDGAARHEQEPKLTDAGADTNLRILSMEEQVALRSPLLFVHPPPRKEWVGLTDDEMESLVTQARKVPVEIPCDSFTTRLLKLAETKLKELNT